MLWLSPARVSISCWDSLKCARQAAILEAEGQGRAKQLVADGEAQAITAIAAALGNSVEPSAYVLALKYLETLGALGTAGTKTVFFPYEASNTMAALGSIRELFAAGGSGDRA